MAEQTEGLIPQEATVSLKETASALQRQQDALFDGQNLRIGFLEKDDQGNNLTEDQKKQQAEKLAQKLNGLKDDKDKPILGHEITAEEIQKLPQEIQKLISERKLSGILVNILGDQPQSSETSALAIVVFLDYIKANPDKPHLELLKEGYQKVTEVLKIAYPQAPQLLSFASSLIDKEGNLSAIVLGDQQITAFNEQGQKKDEGIKEEKEVDGSPKIQTLKLEKGDKVFVCHKDKADKIDGTKGVKETVDSLTKEKTDASSAGAGGEGEERQEPVTIPTAVNPEETLGRLTGEGPIVVDDKDNQSEIYTLDDFRKAIASAQTGEDARIAQLRERIQKINQFLSDADVQRTLTEILPKQDGENDEQYRLRCLLAIKERLAKPGRFEKANDKLSVLLINKGFRSEVVTPQLLQALEGIYYLEIDKQNQEKLRLWEETHHQGKWNIATFISLQRGIVDIGGSIGVFENTPQGKKRREAAERDMRATLLLTNAFASLPYETIVDPTTGEKRTISFNEKIEPLLKARQEAKNDQEREEISRRIEGEYKIYLQRLEEAMRKREWKVNPFGQDEVFQKEAWQKLQLLKPPFTQEKFNQLIELYKQNPSFKRLWEKAQASTEENIRKTFGKDIGALPDFLGYAQKGIEFLERRMELLRIPKPKVEEVPQIIYPKKWVEVGEEPPQESDSTLTTGRTSQRGVDEIDSGDNGNGNGKRDKQDNREDLEPAPASEEDEEERRNNDDNSPPAPDRPPLQTQPEVSLPEVYNFAIVVPPERVEQEAGALARHYRASEKPALGLRIILHPRAFVKNMWQNTFFSQIFNDQAIRFEMGLTEAIRRKLEIDSSVPIQLTPELMDKALEEGKKLRKQQSFWRKIGFIGRDLVANVLGIGQNSKMVLAREWLETQAPPEEINNLLTQSLKDQTDFAQRFALKETGGIKPISEEIGEIRFLLEEKVQNPQLVSGLKGKIKELALAVCDGTKTREIALTELNRYFKTEVYPHLPVDVQKELEGIELSSNLLGLVDFLQKKDLNGKTYLQLYQEQQGKEQGKTKWDELDLKIYLGKGRYETARGDVELTGLQRKLIRRMMERNYAKENGFQFSDVPRAIELFKDIGVFGGSYVLGGLVGAGSFGKGLALRWLHINPVTGTLAMTLAAGLREGPAVARKGRLKGIAGRAWQDFVQVSRESSQGRASQDNAVLRKQFEALLVDQRSAAELTSTITQLLQKETLTPDEQRQLLLAIAHAQARLKMTDLSTRRGKRVLGVGDIEVPQNFISYNFDKRNEELTALRSAILNGAAKLSPEMLSKLQQAQAVFEAQLRIGSVKEKLAGVISRENNLSQQEAQDLVNQFFVDLGITENKSLEGSARRLAGLTWKRMGQTFAMSAVLGTAFKFAIQPVLGEGINLYHDIYHAGGILEGLKEWGSEWGQVLHGDVPIEIDSHGNFIGDLSPLQRGIIQAPYILHNLGLDRLFHTEIPPGETIDLGNAQINMPSGYHLQQADYNHDGIIDTILVNRADGGEVVLGVSGYHLGAVDFDGDGQLDLVLQDQNGQVLINPSSGKSFLEEFLKTKGINISPPQEVVIGSHTVTSNETINPGGERLVRGGEAATFWEKIATHPSKQVWWTNATEGSDYQELRLYNEVYRDTNGNYGIHFIGPTGQGSIDGVHFHEVLDYAQAHGGMQLNVVIPGIGHLPVDMDCDGTGTANDFWLDTSNTHEVLSNGVPIVMPDGHHLTIAELAKMLINQDRLHDHLQQAGIAVSGQPVSLASELRGWLDIFNTGSEERSGYLVAGFTDENGVFNHLATIRGSGSITALIQESPITRQITQEVIDKINIFKLSAPQTSFSLPSLLFIPVRENIEKSVRADKTIPSSTGQGPTRRNQGRLTQQPLTSLTPEQKQKKEQILDSVKQQEERLNEIVRLTDEKKRKEEIKKIAQELGRKRGEIEKALGDDGKRKELARDLALRKIAEESLTEEEKKHKEKEKKQLIKQKIDELRQILEAEEKPATSSFEGKSKDELEGLLRQKKEELEAMKAYPGYNDDLDKSTISEEDKKHIKELREEIAELEASLQVVESEDELRINLDERDYKELKGRIIENLRQQTSLDQINQQLKALGLPELTQTELDQLKTDDKKAGELAKEIIIVSEKRELKSQIIERIYQEEAKKLEGEEKQAYERYAQAYSSILNLRQQLSSITDNAQKQQLQQELNEATGEFNELVSKDEKVKSVLQKLNNQIEQRYEREYKQKTEEEIRRLEERIAEWERAESSIEYKKAQNITMTGHSEKGGRSSDEDAYFDGDFHFGTVFTDDQLREFGVLESSEGLSDLKAKLTQSGLSVAIVADGMGGHGGGEIASAIATVGFIKEIIRNSNAINEQVLEEIIKNVNQYIINYNNLKRTSSGTTLVAQVTDRDGNTYVVSVGDSRVYLVDEKNKPYLITGDDSLVWSLSSEGKIKPWDILINERRNLVSRSLGSVDKYQSQIYKLSLSKGQKLVLCCDGVWEGIDHSKISEELKNRFTQRVQELENQGKDKNNARLIAMREFFGDLFWQLNLGENIANLNPKYLARQEVGNLSGDNVTAVVVNFN